MDRKSAVCTAKYKIGLRRMLLIWFSGIVILGTLLFFALHPQIEKNSIMAEARRMQLAPGSVSGQHPRTGESLLVQAGTEIDFSCPESGVFCVRYTGEKTALQLWVENKETGQCAIYPCPADGSWACLPLPFGAGEYIVSANPYDIGERLSQGEDRALFTLTAVYTDEAEPFRYANLFSSYDENSLEARAARVIEARENVVLGREATQHELADAVVSFVFENIVGDTTTAAQRKNDDAFYYFPDNAATLEEGRGSCADKASVAASMLKSLGIPVRVYYGYIERPAAQGGAEQIYHAWLDVRIEDEWEMYDPSYAPGRIDETVSDKITYQQDAAVVR